MDPEFVFQVRKERGKSFQPLFVASDGQLPKVEANLIKNGAILFNNASYPPDMEGMMRACIDFWLLVNSDLFIRNPASTFSLNVLAKRAAMGKTNNYMGFDIRTKI
jgi:hypothetical protein